MVSWPGWSFQNFPQGNSQLTKGTEESVCDFNHIVHEVELNDRLGLDHVIKHTGVHIAHGIATAT